MEFKNCSKCGTALIPVEGVENLIRRKGDFPQMQDALVIDIRSGYGMFYDTTPTRIILCRECATVLLEQNQWLIQHMLLYAGNIYGT